MDSTTWEVALEFELWASQLQDSDSWGNSTIPHLPQFLHTHLWFPEVAREFSDSSCWQYWNVGIGSFFLNLCRWVSIVSRVLEEDLIILGHLTQIFDTYELLCISACEASFLLTLWAMNDQLGWGIVKILIFLKGMMKIKAEACTRRKRKELQSTVLESAIHFFWLQSWVRRSRHRELPMYISLPIPSFLP